MAPSGLLDYNASVIEAGAAMWLMSHNSRDLIRYLRTVRVLILSNYLQVGYQVGSLLTNHGTVVLLGTPSNVYDWVTLLSSHPMGGAR